MLKNQGGRYFGQEQETALRAEDTNRYFLIRRRPYGAKLFSLSVFEIALSW
jgi:hypothetical protein